MHQYDGECVDALLKHRFELCLNLFLVQRHQQCAIGRHAFVNFDHPAIEHVR
ncbi:hypothetical protein MnTg04_00291 [bacterium MnTg04]|nr:hypothetical protein MnTg04_00291 [bacterium MnTg04]